MQEAKLVVVIAPILEQHGLELDSLDITRMGKRSVLRITVDGDGPKGRGPLLDDIAKASSAISAGLEESPAVGTHPYTLEVSSRGISKPLEAPRHYRRNATRMVKLWLEASEITGRIRSATDNEVSIEVNGAEQQVPFAEIKKAVIQVEMNRPAGLDEEEEN